MRAACPHGAWREHPRNMAAARSRSTSPALSTASAEVRRAARPNTAGMALIPAAELARARLHESCTLVEACDRPAAPVLRARPFPACMRPATRADLERGGTRLVHILPRCIPPTPTCASRRIAKRSRAPFGSRRSQSEGSASSSTATWRCAACLECWTIKPSQLGVHYAYWLSVHGVVVAA